MVRQSKMQMFVNCSPAEYNVSETVCSLNFAKRCRAVELGAAKKNTDSSEVLRLRKQVRQLQEDLTSAGFAETDDGDVDVDDEDEEGRQEQPRAAGSSPTARAAATAPAVPSRFGGKKKK